MDERRRNPRANCRLHCEVQSNGKQINARIVDISEGGLCLFSPEWLPAKTSVDIRITVQGYADATVRAEVWHARRHQLKKSNRKIWAVGLMLEESDEAYQKLLAAAGIAPTATNDAGSTKKPATRGAPRSPAANSRMDKATLDSVEANVFRVRVQARTGPRTRLLTLTAESEAQARALATRDLEGEWCVIEVSAA